MLITCPKCSAKYQVPEEVHLSIGKKVKCSNCAHVFIFNETNEHSDPIPENNPVEEVLPVQTEQDAPQEQVFSDSPVFQDDVPQAFVPVSTPEETPSKRPVGMWMAIISFVILAITIAFGILYKDTLFETLMPTTSIQTPSYTKPDVAKAKSYNTPTQEKQPVISESFPETPRTVFLPQIQSVRFEKRTEPVSEIKIEGVLKNSTTEELRLPEKVRAIAYNSEGAVLFEKEIYLTDSILPAGEDRPFFGSYQPAPNDVQWVEVTF